MNVNEIKALIGKYYEGTTTESEEHQLKAFFASEEVPAELLDEKAFFDAFLMPEPAIPVHLEKRIEHQIDGWNTVEKTVNRRARTVSMRWISGIAASIVLVVSVAIFVNTRADRREYAIQEDTYDNPKDAYAETQRALKLFSSKMNKGLAQISNNKHQNKNKE